ncbi:bifunctional DNA primase/polymerase, partial [Methylobrevis pamukkalensis]|uniref:bifunctional DNA primase/polymerase n=1 Tax=Methylobrevis pamukkalensis TaxID=1439726 RepID=UPI001470C12E
MTDMLEAALAFAARGWRVFPCDPTPTKPRAKSPLIGTDRDRDNKPIAGSGWPAKASADPERIRAWWTRWPKALIGMAPGWADGFVVDLDPKGESVADVEARLVAAIGAPLPACARTITQSGGRHLWFARPEGGLGNGTPGLPNIDIRCDAGYVILPPSVMGNGAAYAWEGEAFDPATAPAAPEALLALIRDKGKVGKGDAPRNPSSAPHLEARRASWPGRWMPATPPCGAMPGPRWTGSFPRLPARARRAGQGGVCRGLRAGAVRGGRGAFGAR